MRCLLHPSWMRLLLPLLGVALAALWLGYGLAPVLGAQPVDGVQIVQLVAAALLLLLGMVQVFRALQQLLLPWWGLAQSVQAASAGNSGQAIEVGPDAPEAVRQMAQALNRLFSRVHADNVAQQRFIADAAHQLRTPLAALQAQVEAWALQAHAAPEQRIVLPLEQVERLRLASRRTTQLAHQLLALSRVESGQAVVTTRVDLKSLCETVFETLLDAALAKNLDLGLEAYAAHVTGQEWLLREMVNNVLDNAIKYTQPGGHVTLRCGRRNIGGGQSRVYVEVEDDGPGVPVGEYTRLTQRFYRVAGTASEGSGLGLSIVDEIAQTHGATLSFAPGCARRGLCVLLLFK